jgi:hypothetical protein
MPPQHVSAVAPSPQTEVAARLVVLWKGQYERVLERVLPTQRAIREKALDIVRGRANDGTDVEQLEACVLQVHLGQYQYALANFGEDLAELFTGSWIPRFDIEVHTPLLSQT